MQKRTSRRLMHLGALILGLSLAAAPATVNAAGGVAFIGGTSVGTSISTEVVVGENDATADIDVNVSKGGVAIRELGYSASAAYVGGEIYALTDSALLRLPAGAEAFEYVARYDNAYSYFSREDIAALSAEEYALAEKTPSMIFSDGETLFGLSYATGAFGPIGADGWIEKQVELDWENMYTEYGVRDMQNAQVIDGALYAQLAPLDSSNGYSSADMRTTRFDLTTGEAKELGLEGEYTLAAYKDGKLLAYAPYGGQDAGVQVYDPATDALGETVVPFEGYGEDAAQGISYNGGGIVYDAQADAVCFVQGGAVWTYKDGVRTETAYIPVDYGSNIRTAMLAGDYYFCTSWDGVYVRSLRAEDQPERTLRISGGYYADDVTRAYTAKTDIPVLFDSNWYSGAEAVKSDMLSGSTENDIYVVSIQSGARALMEKGYLQPLNESTALMDDVARMYPQLQEALTYNGQLYGYPQNLSMNLWSVNPELWELFDLGDYPTTFQGYVDLINTWEEDYAEDNPDYAVTSLYNGKQELMLQALQNYICQYEKPGESITFNTPAFRETMEAIEAMQIETIDWMNLSSEEQEEFWEQMNRPTLFNMSCYATVEQATDFYVTPDGSYEEAKIKSILPPVFEEGKDPVATVTGLTLFVVNPESENVDLAIDFLEYYAEHADVDLRYETHPDLTEPVRQTYYEENRRFYEEQIAQSEAMMAEAAEEEKQSFQENIDWMRAEIENLDQTSWRISEESLANYRELAQYMYIPTDSLFLGGDTAALEVLQDVLSRYLSEQINLDTFIRELDQKVNMIYLEGN